MAREWTDAVEGEVETPFGLMKYAITQGDHVFLSAGGSTDGLPRLVVNRVPYYVNSHLYLQPDGTWARKDWHDPYMSRQDLVEPSRAARDKAYEGIREAWEEFIAGNAPLLADAEARYLNNEIGKVEEEIEKAQAALGRLEADRQALLLREVALG